MEITIRYSEVKSAKARATLAKIPGWIHHAEIIHALRCRQIERFFRFGVVGFSGVFVNMGVLWFLTETIGLYYLVSSLVAVELSIISNFVFNNIWTFRDRSRGVFSFSALLRYNLVCAGAILLSMTLLFVLTNWVGLYYLIANLLAITLTSLWNFAANAAWTWKKSRYEEIRERGL